MANRDLSEILSDLRNLARELKDNPESDRRRRELLREMRALLREADLAVSSM